MTSRRPDDATEGGSAARPDSRPKRVGRPDLPALPFVLRAYSGQRGGDHLAEQFEVAASLRVWTPVDGNLLGDEIAGLEIEGVSANVITRASRTITGPCGAASSRRSVRLMHLQQARNQCRRLLEWRKLRLAEPTAAQRPPRDAGAVARVVEETFCSVASSRGSDRLMYLQRATNRCRRLPRMAESSGVDAGSARQVALRLNLSHAPSRTTLTERRVVRPRRRFAPTRRGRRGSRGTTARARRESGRRVFLVAINPVQWLSFPSRHAAGGIPAPERTARCCCCCSAPPVRRGISAAVLPPIPRTRRKPDDRADRSHDHSDHDVRLPSSAAALTATARLSPAMRQSQGADSIVGCLRRSSLTRSTPDATR